MDVRGGSRVSGRVGSKLRDQSGIFACGVGPCLPLVCGRACHWLGCHVRTPRLWSITHALSPRAPAFSIVLCAHYRVLLPTQVFRLSRNAAKAVACRAQDLDEDGGGRQQVDRNPHFNRKPAALGNCPSTTCCRPGSGTLSMVWACIGCRFSMGFQGSGAAIRCIDRFLVHPSDLKRDIVGRRDNRSVEELRVLLTGLADTERGFLDRSRGPLDEASPVLRLTEVTSLLIDLRLWSVIGLVDDDEASSSIVFVLATPVSPSSSSPISDSLWM